MFSTRLCFYLILNEDSGFLLVQHSRKEAVRMMAVRQHYKEFTELFLLEIWQRHALLGKTGNLSGGNKDFSQ